MSLSRLHRPAAVLPLLLALPLLALGCVSISTHPSGGGTGGRPGYVATSGNLETFAQKDVCKTSKGRGDRQAPVVCIDASSTSNLKNVEVHNHIEGFTMQPVAIKWYLLNSDGPLKIVPLDPGCLARVECPRPDRCTAITDTTPLKSSKQCNYEIRIGDTKIDPVVIVQPCCFDGGF